MQDECKRNGSEHVSQTEACSEGWSMEQQLLEKDQKDISKVMQAGCQSCDMTMFAETTTDMPRSTLQTTGAADLHGVMRCDCA